MDVQIMADNIHDAAVQGRDDEVRNRAGRPTPPAPELPSHPPPSPMVPHSNGQGCRLTVMPCVWCVW